MRYDYDGIDRLPIRPRIKVSVIDGECWFVAQDVWGAIGASHQAIKKIPKEFTRKILLGDDRETKAVNLAGLMFLIAGRRVHLGLPTENTALLLEHASDGSPLESSKDCLEHYGLEVYTVLCGATECITAVGQVQRDNDKRQTR